MSGFANPLFFDIRFFFSSRRRHTRCSRDWSSDVCSSDLVTAYVGKAMLVLVLLLPAALVGLVVHYPAYRAVGFVATGMEIGRASCRERVEVSGVSVEVYGNKGRVSSLYGAMCKLLGQKAE